MPDKQLLVAREYTTAQCRLGPRTAHRGARMLTRTYGLLYLRLQVAYSALVGALCTSKGTAASV